MRTYSRKRPEYKELENVMDLCRLCLQKSDGCLPIYSDNSELYSSLALRIMFCVGLEMVKDEHLPNLICIQCHEEIQNFYLFRKKCEMSNMKLKSHIQAVKAKEYNDNETIKLTINLDGSIQLQDGNIGLRESDEPLAKLTKLFHDEGRVSNTEVLQVFSKTAQKIKKSIPPVLEKSFVLDQSNKIQEQSDLSKQIKLEISPESKQVVLDSNPTDPEISEFLTSMLTQLGILTQCGDGVLDFGPKTNRTLELETKDGNNITFELVEEDENMENRREQCQTEVIVTNKELHVGSKHSAGPSSPGKRAGVRCVQCGKELASRGVLARHVRNVHARARPHACATCGKTFAQKEVLARHKLVHEAKRPFQCASCPKSYTQRAALAAHARLHAPPAARPLTLHQCPHCTKLFLYASGLSRHLLLHNNTRFLCVKCDRPFSDKSSLRRHERNARHNKAGTKYNKEKRSAKKVGSAANLQTSTDRDNAPAKSLSPKANT